MCPAPRDASHISTTMLRAVRALKGRLMMMQSVLCGVLAIACHLQPAFVACGESAKGTSSHDAEVVCRVLVTACRLLLAFRDHFFRRNPFRPVSLSSGLMPYGLAGVCACVFYFKSELDAQKDSLSHEAETRKMSRPTGTR